MEVLYRWDCISNFLDDLTFLTFVKDEIEILQIR